MMVPVSMKFPEIGSLVPFVVAVTCVDVWWCVLLFLALC